MFTGIITGTGQVTERSPDPAKGVERLSFDAPGHVAGLSLGGSIAVNGACVSAVAISGEQLTVELIPETLKRTTFGELSPGDVINLERCLPAGARLDGHVVQGHVDGIGTLIDRDRTDGRHRFQVPADLAEFLAEKGSIAVDGVSLTITAVGHGHSEPHRDAIEARSGVNSGKSQPMGERGLPPGGTDSAWFEVALIPATLAETTLGSKELGSTVNLEVDVLAKYVKRMLHFGQEESSALQAPAERSALPPVLQPATPAPLLDPIEVALNQLAAGRPVVVVDDADRENEGDLIFPAAAATAELMGFTIRYSSGVICTPMTEERARHLKLPPMVTSNEDPKGTAYTISCDAVAVESTGISAYDRAVTATTLADSGTGAADLTRPGHMFPLIADPQGVLGRDGHTEAAVDLCRLSGYPEVAVIAELVHEDGSMMRLPALREFADRHELTLISIADLIEYRGGTPKPDAVRQSYLTSWEAPQDEAPKLVAGGPVVALPTDFGIFDAQVWTERATGQEHILLSAQGAQQEPPLVRLHSECLTGDVMHSHRCDCGTQLASALETIHEAGGYLLYLRGHEGRGIGLANKLRAYKLQEQGADTVEANEMLGLAAELRDYTGAAAILHSAGITELRLLTNNPAKVQALAATGLQVSQVPSNGVVHPDNERYLRTKRDRMAHMLDHLALNEQNESAQETDTTSRPD